MTYHCTDCGHNFREEEAVEGNPTRETSEAWGQVATHTEVDLCCPDCGCPDLEDITLCDTRGCRNVPAPDSDYCAACDLREAAALLNSLMPALTRSIAVLEDA